MQLLYLCNSPGKNTGAGIHSLLQEIFPAQGLNPDLPHCRWILYHLSHQGTPKLATNILKALTPPDWSRGWPTVRVVLRLRLLFVLNKLPTF